MIGLHVPQNDDQRHQGTDAAAPANMEPVPTLAEIAGRDADLRVAPTLEWRDTPHGIQEHFSADIVAQATMLLENTESALRPVDGGATWLETPGRDVLFELRDGNDARYLLSAVFDHDQLGNFQIIRRRGPLVENENNA